MRKLGLDDNQRALLEIASQPTPKAELRTVREIVELKRAAAHARNGSVAAVVGNKKTTAEINTLEADIREKQESLERLQGKLAANRKRLREIEDKLAIQGVAKAGDGQSIVPDEDADQSAHRIAGEGKFERLKVRWKNIRSLLEGCVRENPGTVRRRGAGLPRTSQSNFRVGGVTAWLGSPPVVNDPNRSVSRRS